MSKKRCVLGCSSSQNLFSFPKIPWLRARWLEFIHFEEGGIFESSRLCDRHFTVDSFRNYMQVSMGFAARLLIGENAIPTVHTVGASSAVSTPPLRPQTRDVGCQYSPPMKPFASQVSFPAPRPKRRSKGIQVKPAVRSVSVGCSMDSVVSEPPLFMSTPVKRPRLELNSSIESSGESESCTVEPQDSTYVPDVTQDDHEDQESALYNTTKYIVYHDNLMKLFRTCPTCSHTCQINTFVVGTLVSITQVCSHCHHKLQWNSQPYIGNTPAGNLQLSAAVAFNGASYIQIHKVLSSLRVECICPRTYYNHQRAFLQPAILWHWRAEQQVVMERAKQSGKPITLGGDMRADSPGHCAKFGSYSMLNLDDNRVIDIQLVQSNEVGNSGRMELHGFVKSLKFLKEAGVKVGTVVTDRHPSVQKYMREKQEDILHYYDTWHVSKGLSKKIDALGKQKNCGEVLLWRKSAVNHVYWCASSSKGRGEEAVEKWKSITNHVQNVHHHESELFPDCAHPPLDERAWLRPNTKACEMFCDLMLQKRLLKDMAKLSPHHQTSSIEGFHSLILRFAPKNVVFPFMGMLCRLLLAALHYNENADRGVVCNADGEPVVRVRWPKYKKGEYSLCYTKTAPTYNYVDILQTLVLEEVVFSPGPYQQLRDQVVVPENLCAAFERPNIQEAMASKWSRYTQEEE